MINLAGAAAIIGWTTVISGGIFAILKAFKILRVPEELELKGGCFILLTLDSDDASRLCSFVVMMYQCSDGE